MVAISDYTSDICHKLVKRHPKVIFPSYSGTIPRTVQIKDGALTNLSVLSVGRFERRKGHLELIRAIAILRDQGRNVHLDLVGRGPLEPEINSLIAQLNLRDQVSIHVDASQDVLHDLYETSDCFALLTADLGSGFEGFGIVFLEAAAHGLPIVSGSSGGALQAVDPGGNAFISDDSQDAAQALSTLMDDPESRRRMSEHGRRFVRRFAPTVATTELLNLYESVVKKGA